MTILRSTLDTTSAEFGAARQAMEGKLDQLATDLEPALSGGGERKVARHRERGKFTARERIDMILDPESPFLELCALAAWGSDFQTGASVVAGIGVVEGVECLLIANDPTVKGGTSNPWTLRKVLRLNDVAMKNRIPVISLVESGGADLPTQKEVFVPGGALFRDLTRLSKAGIPTIAVVYGNSTAGGAYVPGMSDHVVMIEERSKVFLAGPPLVKAATGEIADEETLGGADMHARVSGLADHLAVDEADAARLTRGIVRRLNWTKAGRAPRAQVAEPLYGTDELLGIVPEDLRIPFDPREIIARIVDGSVFDEFKPLYGASLVTGWAELHGYPVGIIANARGVLFSEEAQKATEFILLCNQTDTPLIFLQNTTGYMVGTSYEQGGIIKDGAKMINAVTNSTVPHFTINMGGSFGAGNYGMSGRAYGPRFMFTWANARLAVMGAAQLAGVMSIVGRESAASAGRHFDEEADVIRTAEIEKQIDAESHPFFVSARIYDDGVIDPRDTREILAIALSAAHSNKVEGRRGFGVFRM